nr:unnamed protein product [Spirometra erinaceieuropaei]
MRGPNINTAAYSGVPLKLSTIDDFDNALDSFRLESVWSKMSVDGGPEKIIAMVKVYHRFTAARIIVNTNLFRPYGIRSGVRQDCTLSPILSNYAIVWILEKARHADDGADSALGRRLVHHDYADDIAMPAASFGDLLSLVSKVNEVAKSLGVSLNAWKTRRFPVCIFDQ